LAKHALRAMYLYQAISTKGELSFQSVSFYQTYQVLPINHSKIKPFELIL